MATNALLLCTSFHSVTMVGAGPFVLPNVTSQQPSLTAVQLAHTSTWSARRALMAVRRPGSDGAAPTAGIFIIGGSQDDDTCTPCEADVWSSEDGTAFDTIAVPSSSAEAVQRTDASAVVLGGHILVMGGIHAQKMHLGDVWSSPDGANWTKLNGIGADFGRRYSFAAAAVHLRGEARVIVMGGVRNNLIAPWPGAAAATTRRLGSRRLRRAALPDSGQHYVGDWDPGVTRLGDMWSSADGATWRKEWDELPFRARESFAVATVPSAGENEVNSASEVVFVMGGLADDDANPGSGSTVLLNDVWSSVDGGEHWTPLTRAAPWEPRAALSVVALCGWLVLAGGRCVAATGNSARGVNGTAGAGASTDTCGADVWVSPPSNTTWLQGRDWVQLEERAPWGARSSFALIAEDACTGASTGTITGAGAGAGAGTSTGPTRTATALLMGGADLSDPAENALNDVWKLTLQVPIAPPTSPPTPVPTPMPTPTPTQVPTPPKPPSPSPLPSPLPTPMPMPTPTQAPTPTRAADGHSTALVGGLVGGAAACAAVALLLLRRRRRNSTSMTQRRGLGTVEDIGAANGCSAAPGGGLTAVLLDPVLHVDSGSSTSSSSGGGSTVVARSRVDGSAGRERYESAELSPIAKHFMRSLLHNRPGLVIPRDALSIGGRIGFGASGQVFEGALSDGFRPDVATDVGADADVQGHARSRRRVALKEVRFDTTAVSAPAGGGVVTQGSNMAQRMRQAKAFVNEVSTLASLHHPNVIRFLGVVAVDGWGQGISGGDDGSGGGSSLGISRNHGVCPAPAPGLMLVTAFVPLSLRQILDAVVDGRRATLQTAELQRLLVGLGRGLAYIHERDVIHRDIKPSNILVTDSGEARICDFGIARQLQTSASGSEVTYTGQQGSPRYMAPEVIRSERYSNKVDIYSFAITMYECWTGGQDPYDGLSAFEIMEGVSRRGLRPAVPLPLPTSVIGGSHVPSTNTSTSVSMSTSDAPPTELLQAMWDENQDARPTATDVVDALGMLA